MQAWNKSPLPVASSKVDAIVVATIASWDGWRMTFIPMQTHPAVKVDGTTPNHLFLMSPLLVLPPFCWVVAKNHLLWPWGKVFSIVFSVLGLMPFCSWLKFPQFCCTETSNQKSTTFSPVENSRSEEVCVHWFESTLETPSSEASDLWALDFVRQTTKSNTFPPEIWGSYAKQWGMPTWPQVAPYPKRSWPAILISLQIFGSKNNTLGQILATKPPVGHQMPWSNRV